jgi:periplasmic protein TonB
MEPKKNPKIDLHNKRGVFFNLSLVLSLVVVIMAFKWRAPIPNGPGCELPTPATETDITYVPSTDFNTVPDVPKPASTEKVQVIATQDFKEVKELLDNGTTIQIEPKTAEVSTEHIVIEPEVVDESKTWSFVESMPHPEGGYDAFYADMRKNFKYPRRAIQRGTTGKVYVEFVVERNGELSELKVVRGIGDGCDEEALRVVSLSKWRAGKQRGKPVRVRMVQPIAFELQVKQ